LTLKRTLHPLQVIDLRLDFAIIEDGGIEEELDFLDALVGVSWLLLLLMLFEWTRDLLVDRVFLEALRSDDADIFGCFLLFMTTMNLLFMMA
jgi:hypothetical protein